MKQKTTILLVRHGQTEWNVARRFQGHQDSPLTELGVRQAEWLGESLQHERIDAVYSSSSPRARRTAEIIIAPRDMEIIESDDLKEINLGVWEGQSQETAEREDEEQFHYFWNDPEHFHVHKSETFQEVSERAVRKLQQIVAEEQGKTILIVAHTVVVKVLMAYFEGRELRDIWNPPYIHPACLCKVELTDHIPDILLHGDIQHYKEEPTVR
ncbi:histidine phosphatase family protein [Paenibacillus marinisediminis]